MWSLIIGLAGITGVVLTGQRKAIGWLLSAIVQLLFIAYGYAFAQWGFVVQGVVLGTVFFYYWLDWRKQAL